MYGKIQIEWVWETLSTTRDFHLGYYVITLGERSIMVKDPNDVVRIINSYMNVVPNIRKHYDSLKAIIKEKYGIGVTDDVEEFINNHVLTPKKEDNLLVTSFMVNRDTVYHFNIECVEPKNQ